jgi:YfiR/HmsC-like
MPASDISQRSTPAWSGPTAIAIAVALLCCQPTSSWTQQAADESQIKAAFLFNFGKFVEWPEPAASAKGPLAICVAGNDEVARALQQLAFGKTVNGKEVKVVLLRTLDSSGSCKILFIGRAASKDKKALLEKTQNVPVLTVGEEEDFAEQGGIVNFLSEKKSIHFEVNLEAATQSGLKISSKLLALAQIVRSKS